MSLSVFKWLCNKARTISIPLIFTIINSALLSVVGVRFALVSRDAIDIATGQAKGTLSNAFLRIAILLIIQIVLIIIGGLLDVRVRGKLEIRIKRDLFCRLLKKDWQKLSQ